MGVSASWKKKLFFTVFCCLILTLFCEAAIRLLFHTENPFKRRFFSLQNNDSSWRLKFIERKTKRNIVTPDGYNEYNPSRGWTLKPNIRDLVISAAEVINTNSKGARGTAEYGYKKAEGKKRILVLGDSFTFGVGVNDHETYSYLLQKMFSDTEVINLGSPGYGHDQMLLYLREEGVKYKPDIVILGFLSGDMLRNMLSFMDYAKPKFEVIDNKLVLKNSPVPPVEKTLKYEFYRLKILDLLDTVYKDHKWASGTNDKKMRTVTQAILTDMAKTIRQMAAVPVFVYMPSGWGIEDASCDDLLLNVCNRQRVDCITLLPVFNDSIRKGEVLCKGPTHHWAPGGHKVAAREIGRYLTEKTLLDNPAGL